MKFYPAIILLFICGGCTKNTPSVNNPVSSMSAQINGVNWSTSTFELIEGNDSNQIKGIIGKSGGTNIEIDVLTYPSPFATGSYSFRPAGIEGVTINSLHSTLNSQGNIVVSWSTSNEVNLDNFSVERSNDGITFTVIGVVPAQDNSSGTASYEFTDLSPVSEGENYYRLEVVSSNGNIQYSNITAYNAITIIDGLYNNSIGTNGALQVITSDTTNHIITGTFSFDCTVQSQSVQIRNGKFNIHY